MLIIEEPLFETDMFICASGIPNNINILKLWASCPDHSPSSLIKFLPEVTEIWVGTDAHTGQITRVTTGGE